MPAHVRVSGSYQEVAEIHAKVSGTWQEVQEGWVKVSGTWEQFYFRGIESTLTYGQGGSFETGYRAWGVGGSHFGSLSVTDVEGETVSGIETNAGGNQLSIRISGTSVPQSHFTSFECSLGTFNTSSATYTANDGNGQTLWQWDPGGSFSSSGSEVVTFVP